jgi:signal transduction histidine kinase
MKRWRSFPLQLFLFVVLPLTALLLAIAFGGLGLHQQAMRTMVGERDERATRAAATAISEQLKHRASAVRSLALQTAVSTDPQHTLADADFILPDFDGGIALFDSQGNILAASEQAQPWATHIQEILPPDSFTNSLNEAQFIPLNTNEYADNELLLVVAKADEGHLAVGAFSPEDLARRALMDIVGSDEKALVFVVSPDGQIIFQSGSLPLAEQVVNQHPGIADALRGESGTIYLSVSGDEHVIAFSPIAPVNWALVIEEPWREVADPLLRATEMAPLVLVPVVVITLIALWFGVRQIVQPLQSLEQKATELGWGRFEAIEEPVGGINEIQRLQSELIHMAHKVKLAQQSLRGYLGAVTTGQEEERRRLARDLHDDTLQSMIALNQRVQMAQLTTQEPAYAAQLQEMQAMIDQTIANLRRLTRDLRPIYLEDLGLVPALDMLTRDASTSLEIPVTLHTTGSERRLSATEELALYRMGQEALSNIARHAHASCAKVKLHFAEDEITLVVYDDGVGFEVPESPAEMAATGHYGLLGIQERAELIGAHVAIESESGTGTILTIRQPNNGRFSPDTGHLAG